MELPQRQQLFSEICWAQSYPEDAAKALGAPASRLKLYRSMIRNRLLEMLELGLPKTKELLGAARWKTEFSQWLSASPPRSRFIRDVVAEYASYQQPRWRLDSSLPPAAVDLLRYESVRWSLADLDASLPVARDFTFDRPLVLNPVLDVLRLDYSVHKERLDEAATYEKGPVNVCLVRALPDAVEEHERVLVWSVNDLMADLLLAWKEHSSDSAAAVVQQVAKRRKSVVSPQFIESLCTVLADFMTKGIVLGSAP